MGGGAAQKVYGENVYVLFPSLTIGYFLNLRFAKPMVCVRVAFHENDANHENGENDEDNPDSYKQGVACWIRGNHGNHENDKSHRNPGCKPQVPQTTGLEIPDTSKFHFVRRCVFKPPRAPTLALPYFGKSPLSIRVPSPGAGRGGS